jgi:hypothetical protein
MPEIVTKRAIKGRQVPPFFPNREFGKFNCMSAEQPRERSAPPPRFLNSREVAQIMRTTTQTISRWLRQGCGPMYMRIGGRCLYEAGAVEEFLRVRQCAGEQ